MGRVTPVILWWNALFPYLRVALKIGVNPSLSILRYVSETAPVIWDFPEPFQAICSFYKLKHTRKLTSKKNQNHQGSRTKNVQSPVCYSLYNITSKLSEIKGGNKDYMHIIYSGGSRIWP